MKKSKIIERLRTLLERIDRRQYVPRSSLFRVLGESDFHKIDSEWILELKSRKFRPKEIVEYSRRVRIGQIHYSMGDKYSLKGDGYKARKSFHKAEALFENAVDYLKAAISCDSSLMMWIDRDVGFGIEFVYCPEGIPRPIWTSSNYRNRCVLPKVSKRDIVRGLLQTKLEEIDGRAPFELVYSGIRPRRSLDFSSFSDFKV